MNEYNPSKIFDGKCSKCNDTGEVLVSGDIYMGEPEKMLDTCPDCKGKKIEEVR